ncbi:hypothetical protein [Streptomyces sp. 21So2-11]|uniref:hypothetical protein n=1 Tax=Streptomyces sp. 21So2-11 TaxID=3144408 RepID=UPI00321A438B
MTMTIKVYRVAADGQRRDLGSRITVLQGDPERLPEPLDVRDRCTCPRCGSGTLGEPETSISEGMQNWCRWHAGPTDTELGALVSESNSGPPRLVTACKPCRDTAEAAASERARVRAAGDS